MKDNRIVCRCSDVTLEEIRQKIREGYTSIDELRRIIRIGMGPCQGKTCIPIILKEISNITGKPISKLNPGTYRPTTTGIKLQQIADQVDTGGDEYE